MSLKAHRNNASSTHTPSTIMLVIRTITSIPTKVCGLFSSSSSSSRTTTIATAKAGECLGCFEPRLSLQLHQGTSHQHESPYCEQCFGNFIRFRLAEAGVHGAVNQCPSPNCKHVLTTNDLERNLIADQLIAAFTRFVNESKLRWVTCPNCKTCIECPKDDQTATCTVCRPETKICCKCQLVAHKGACQSDAEDAIKKLLLTRGFRACPGCAQFIERPDGCNHMYHPSCQTHFCYDCGAKLRDDGSTDAHALTPHFPNGSSMPCKNGSKKA